MSVCVCRVEGAVIDFTVNSDSIYISYMYGCVKFHTCSEITTNVWCILMQHLISKLCPCIVAKQHTHWYIAATKIFLVSRYTSTMDSHSFYTLTRCILHTHSLTQCHVNVIMIITHGSLLVSMTYVSESLEVDDQDIREGPQRDLLCSILLLASTVRTEPLVLSIQLE